MTNTCTTSSTGLVGALRTSSHSPTSATNSATCAIAFVTAGRRPSAVPRSASSGRPAARNSGGIPGVVARAPALTLRAPDAGGAVAGRRDGSEGAVRSEGTREGAAEVGAEEESGGVRTLTTRRRRLRDGMDESTSGWSSSSVSHTEARAGEAV
jgi:hypothetical protein